MPRFTYPGRVSIAVDLDDLAAATAQYGFAYLLTVGDDGRPHAVALRPIADGCDLTVAVGQRTAANAAARPAVALVYPPSNEGGMSLVIDGTAAARDGTLVITATRAVLHRAAPDG